MTCEFDMAQLEDEEMHSSENEQLHGVTDWVEHGQLFAWSD
jgi:hypothetical protein